MKLTLTAFGIAREIIDASTKQLTVQEVQSIADLKTFLTKEYPRFAELMKFSLAVGEEYRDDDYILTDGDEVVIIPPVSGG